MKFGQDTGYIKHRVVDLGEPHQFDANFDPYLTSRGYDKATITVHAGGKEPCSLMSPTISMPAVVDPKVDINTIKLMPLADATQNKDLLGYPKTLTGSFLQIMVEANSNSDLDWRNIHLETILPQELGKSEVVFTYNACPRPLVPGDDIGIFKAGWRFNQPEGEVLVKLGNTMPFMQSGRKAYFIVLLKLDPAMKVGVYPVHFKLSADECLYTGEKKGSFNYELPDALFSICKKTADKSISQYAHFVIGQATLGNLQVRTTPYFQSLNDARFSANDVNYTEFNSLTKKLPTSSTNGESIDLSGLGKFPTSDTTSFTVLEKGLVVSRTAVKDPTINPNDFNVPLSSQSSLAFDYKGSAGSTEAKGTKVAPIGPRVVISKAIATVNGKLHTDGKDDEQPTADGRYDIKVAVDLTNTGNDVAQNVSALSHLGEFYEAIVDSLPVNVSQEKEGLMLKVGNLVPGETRRVYIHFEPKLSSSKLKSNSDPRAIISDADLSFSSTIIKGTFGYNDPVPVLYGINEFKLASFTTDRAEYTAGDIAKLDVKVNNLILDAKNVKLGIYSVIKKDTVLIKSVNIAEFAASNSYNFQLDYPVRDSIYKMSFLARIDDNKKFYEITKKNNEASQTIKILGPPDVIRIQNYPNPFKTNTKLSYTVTGKLKDIKIIVYSSIKQEMLRQENCSIELGENTLDIALPEYAASGVYLLKIVGTDLEGKTHEFLGKLLKD